MLTQPPRQRIAIVEDDEAVLNSLEFMFRAAGYEVSAYERAGDASASPEISAAVCLIVDYALPDYDGLTLLAELRRKGVRAPAILIASTPSVRCRQQARDAGVPLMEKPLDSESLSAWVRLLVGRSANGAGADEAPVRA